MPKLRDSDDGFTLIELIVVILIISILAAIALPNFVKQGDRAHDATAKANARSTVTHVEACYTSSEDYQACTTTAGLGTGLNIPLGTGPDQVEITSSAKDAYIVKARSTTGNWYAMTKTAGTWTIVRSCGTASGSDVPGCKGGSW